MERCVYCDVPREVKGDANTLVGVSSTNTNINSKITEKGDTKFSMLSKKPKEVKK